jgi:ABC-2 type transport system permease protein
MKQSASLLASTQPLNRPEIFWTIDNYWVLTKRSLTHIIRNTDQLISVFLMPVMFLLLFRYVFGGAINTGETSYVNFLVAGILVQTAAFGANTTTFSVLVDLQRGIVDRFRALPMASSALLAAHVVADLARNTISALVMLAAGFLVGFRPTADPYEWLLVFGLLMIFTFSISWVSAILGMVVKTLEAAQWAGFIVLMPLTFASSAFVPTDSMPTVLRVFAENQPLTHVIEAMRAWMVGTPIDNHGWLALAWCVGILVVAMPFATWMFRRRQ